MKAIYKTKSPEETLKLGENLAKKLLPGDSILLYGDIGAGKTQFSKGVAKGLGIAENIKSPTYTYVNHFQLTAIDSPLFHYDLYRLNEGDDLSSIGFWESAENEQAINIIEWANRIKNSGINKINSRLIVTIEGINEERKITIAFHRSTELPESEIKNYYKEWATPIHVQDHCKTVTHVAMQIAQAYIKIGKIINLELLYTACMLHDMNRICDFKELNRDKFFEKITDEKWNKWLNLREKYKGIHHAEISYSIFKERGFTKTADVIQAHRSNYLITRPELFDSLEKKIIYYADKRAKHDEIVGLKERFRDGKERYKKFSNPNKQKLFDEVEKTTHKLEDELFEPLDINPKDIL